MKFIMLLSLLVFVSCSNGGANISTDLCKGAISISDLSIEFKEVQSAAGGSLINAEGIVPCDIKKEQVKPTIMQTLKNVLVKYPSCQEVYVRLTPDHTFNHYVGHATYIAGKVKIHYGIPSDAEIDKKNANIGKAVPGGLFGDDKKRMIIIDHPRIYRPDSVTFEKIMRFAVEKKAVDDHVMDWKTLSKKIAKKNGMLSSDAEQLYYLLEIYYCSGCYGEETFQLKDSSM